MAVTPVEYASVIRNLLPPGVAFPRGDSSSLLAMLIEVWGSELSRLDSRAQALIEEADPRVCQETFTEWLEQWGIPDDCMKLWSRLNNSTLRQMLLHKVRNVGGQSVKFFMDLAEMFGYWIEIDEFREHSVVSDTLDMLCDSRWPHRWKVNVLTGSGGKMTYHDVVGGAEEPLAWWGDALIECLIRRYAPAHTELTFAYIEEN